MSALISYENYTRPFAGFGQSSQQETWFRRNWAFILQVVGLAFVAGGMVARKYIDREVPQTEKITPQDWDMLVASVQRFYPKMPRPDIELKLCELFGTRAPFCANLVEFPEPERLGMRVPQWLWIAALGVGAVLLLK